MPDIKLEIGEGQIQNAIALALVDAFSSEKKDQLIRDVVRAHLTARSDSWGRDTILSKAVGDMLRKTAEDKMRETVASWKPDIEAMVVKKLGEPFKNSIISSLEKSLSNLLVSNLRVDVTAVQPVGDED
jgi:hypothetical protein